MVILRLGEQYSVELQQHNELKFVNVNTSANALQFSALHCNELHFIPHADLQCTAMH